MQGRVMICHSLGQPSTAGGEWRVEGNLSVCVCVGVLALLHDIVPQCRWSHRWLIFIPQALRSHRCGNGLSFPAISFTKHKI